MKLNKSLFIFKFLLISLTIHIIYARNIKPLTILDFPNEVSISYQIKSEVLKRYTNIREVLSSIDNIYLVVSLLLLISVIYLIKHSSRIDMHKDKKNSDESDEAVKLTGRKLKLTNYPDYNKLAVDKNTTNKKKEKEISKHDELFNIIDNLKASKPKELSTSLEKKAPLTQDKLFDYIFN